MRCKCGQFVPKRTDIFDTSWEATYKDTERNYAHETQRHVCPSEYRAPIGAANEEAISMAQVKVEVQVFKFFASSFTNGKGEFKQSINGMPEDIAALIAGDPAAQAAALAALDKAQGKAQAKAPAKLKRTTRTRKPAATAAA